MGCARTAADGTFKTTFPAGKDGTWQARYEQVANEHFEAASREDLVDVR